MSTSAAAQARGCSAGAFTAALAVAAHGLGAGQMALPGGSSVLLLVLAGVVGAFTATCPRAAQAVPLLGVLAAGQVLGHIALSIGAHHGTSQAAAPSSLMVAAHAAAVVVGAGLIRLGEHLFAALSRTLACRAYRGGVIPAVAALVPERRADQPWRRLQLIAASISHRGPPRAVLT